MSENGGMLALNNNWLDSASTQAQCSGDYNSQTVLTTGGLQPYPWNTGYIYYPSSWYYPVYVTSQTRPIKLTLSEVERLRKLARADSKVKAILAKFTDQIEITVDFE